MKLKQSKEVIKLFLSHRYIRWARRYFGGFWHSFISSTYFLSIPASYLNPFVFMREQRAVRAGKARYYQNTIQHKTVSFVGLRRNIHRLEKALIMRPRRDVFAKDYIMETVEWYSSIIQEYKTGIKHDESELAWAYNVLTEYFSVVKAEGIIKRSKELFQLVEFSKEEKNFKPYIRLKPSDLPNYKQLLSLSVYRRSVRWFKSKKVSRDIIDNALLVARQSPTACNRMPYEFMIFDKPSIVKKISNIPFGTGGYANNIPTIAVLVGRLDSYYSARDRHAIYVDSSLAAMSFVYALEVQGVSTCLINWPDFEPLEREMQKTLNLNVSDRPIMLIAIGYADNSAAVPSSIKKDLENIRSYNKL